MTKLSMQSGAAVVAVAGAPEAEKAAVPVGRGVEATEQEAKEIICTATRAMEEEEAAKAKTARSARDGASSAAGKPSLSSLKRSLECFLQGRKNKATSSPATRRRLESFSTTSLSTSSSSSN